MSDGSCPMQLTVSANARGDAHARARRIAAAIPGLRQVERDAVDWSRPVLLCSRAGLLVRSNGRELRWHPGMLHAKLASGERYPLARALELAPGELLIDATLGLGTDAAYVRCRFDARVVGVEASPALALLTAEGLRGVRAGVAVVCADSGSWLASLPTNAAPVVYADPLFPWDLLPERPTHTLDAVRILGRRQPLDSAWLREARRVASRQVVVRAHARSQLLQRLGAPEILRPRSGRPQLGIWRVAD